jgi:hypothetical protein
VALDAPSQEVQALVDVGDQGLLLGQAQAHPALAAALSSAAEHNSHDQALDAGFDLILDGVEKLIAEGAQHARGAGGP